MTSVRGLRAIDESHLVPDQVAHGRAQFGTDAVGEGLRRDASRLGVTDQPGRATAQGQADLWQLGALAAAGRPTDDDHLVRLDRAPDLVAPGMHWQRVVEHHARHGRTTRVDQRDGGADLRLQPFELARVGRRGPARETVESGLQAPPVTQQALWQQLAQGCETRRGRFSGRHDVQPSCCLARSHNDSSRSMSTSAGVCPAVASAAST